MWYASDDQLKKLYDLLWDETRVSGKPSAAHLIQAYETFRATECYQAIRNKISQNQLVTMTEYLFFALVTDDVSQLDPDKLDEFFSERDALRKSTLPDLRASIDKFKFNLVVLAAALREQNAPTEWPVNTLMAKLDSRDNCEIETISILNLSGLTVKSLQFDGRAFNHCFLGGVTFERGSLVSARASVFFQTTFSPFAMKSLSRFVDCDFIDLSIEQKFLSDAKFVGSRFSRVNIQVGFISSLTFDDCHIESSVIKTDKSISDVDFFRCIVNNSAIAFGNITQSTCCRGCVFTQSQVSGVIDPVSPYGLPYATFECHFIASDLRASTYADKLSETILDKNHFSEGSLILDDEQFASFEAFNQLLNNLMAPLVLYVEKYPMYRYEVLSSALKNLADILCSHIVMYAEGFPYPSYGTDLLNAALRHPLFHLQGYGSYVSQVSRFFVLENASTQARANIQAALNAMEPVSSSEALCVFNRF